MSNDEHPEAGSHYTQLRRLRARLEKQLTLQDVVITLPRSGRDYTILEPSDHDRLLDEAEADPEQNLPYWAEIWPSGIALADVVLARGAELSGRPVLELGSGLGITATAALEVGAALVAADYSTTSLTLCRYNTLRNAGRVPRLLQFNWRIPTQDLLGRAASLGGYPIILAADVLYESRDVDPMLTLVGQLLAPDGTLWLAEPGRETAARFLALAAGSGWRSESEVHEGPWPYDTGVRVGVHFLRREA
jgi:predicted nicotinamide N-methyase